MRRAAFEPTESSPGSPRSPTLPEHGRGPGARPGKLTTSTAGSPRALEDRDGREVRTGPKWTLPQ